MIRINLLPVKAAKKREQAERVLFVMGLVVLATAAGLFVVHRIQAKGLDEIAAQNNDYLQKIEKLKKEVGDFDLLKAQREQLVGQREVIHKLEADRAGPMHALLELGRLLSQGGQPTMDASWYEQLMRENPGKAYDPTWDPRRVVVTSYSEKEDGKTYLEGFAKDNSDVAEFVRRLDLSKYFDEPYIERSDTVPTSSALTGIKHVKFTLNLRGVH